jgi:methionyl-tRNA synthetase
MLVLILFGCYNAFHVRMTNEPEEILMASIEDFKKIELVVAQIKEVKEHPNADRLYILQVDTGKDVRQIVAGIRKAYTPEQLINRRIILIANMDPAVIRGEVSNGMLLAASDENAMALLAPDKDMALGSIVK